MSKMRMLMVAALVLTRTIVMGEEMQALVCDRTVSTAATGYFRTEQDARGVWRLVTPDGHGFFAMGCNGPVGMRGAWCPVLGYAPYTRVLAEKYGKDREKWSADTIGRLLGWGFNSVNNWEPPDKALLHRGIAHARVLSIGRAFARKDPNCESNLIDNVRHKGVFPNVFHPDFPKFCHAYAERHCAPSRGDPWVLGWFLDNEISWRGALKSNSKHISEDASEGLAMYTAVADLPEGHSARKALDQFLAARGLSTTSDVPNAVRQDFLRLVANEYFRITIGAIRAVDPDHMILGVRFMGLRATPNIAWEVAGKWCDVISVNWYPPVDFTNKYVKVSSMDTRPFREKVKELYALGQRPILITEWSFPALDAGLSCKRGAGQRVPTQKERAYAAGLFVRTLAECPEVVGHFHFSWVDQPKLGRFDGESCNYGLIREDDVPWKELTDAFRLVHSDVYSVRQRAPMLPIVAPLCH